MTRYCTACGEPLTRSWVCLVCEYEQKTGHALPRTPERPIENAEPPRLFWLPPRQRRVGVKEQYENSARGGHAA